MNPVRFTPVMSVLALIPLVLAALLGTGCRDTGGKSGSSSSSSGGAIEKIPAHQRMALENAKEMELLSLDPHFGPQTDPEVLRKLTFHNCEVLGRTPVRDPAVQRELVAAIEKAAENNHGTAAACFEPHHALRVTTGAKTLDFVICFECLQVRVYDGDARDLGFLITDEPRALFDRVLAGAGVPLPDRH